MSKIIKSLIVLSSLSIALNLAASEEINNEAGTVNSPIQENSSLEVKDSSDSNKVEQQKPEKPKKKKNKKKHKHKHKHKNKAKQNVDASKPIEDTSSVNNQEIDNKVETK